MDDFKAKRTELGLTQKQAADAVGISATIYGKIERGEVEPSETLRGVLRKYFGLTGAASSAPPQGTVPDPLSRPASITPKEAIISGAHAPRSIRSNTLVF